MENNIIRVAMPQGDVNGVGYELTLKMFADPTMFELCTPVVYGQPKVAAAYKKSLDLAVGFNALQSVEDVQDAVLNLVACGDSDAFAVEPGTPNVSAIAANLPNIDRAAEECKEGYADVLVTLPISDELLKEINPDSSGYIPLLAEKLGNGAKSAPLTILVDNDLRVAFPANAETQADAPLTQEMVMERIQAFNYSLKNDFGINAPRIALLEMDYTANSGELGGSGEKGMLAAASSALSLKGVICYGAYAADYLLDDEVYTHFDGILAMSSSQAIHFFRSLCEEDGAALMAALPVVCTFPLHGELYGVAGQGIASEAPMRQAVYMAIDVFRNRKREQQAKAAPLRRQYYEKRDDSDKLKQLAAADEDVL